MLVKGFICTGLVLLTKWQADIICFLYNIMLGRTRNFSFTFCGDQHVMKSRVRDIDGLLMLQSEGQSFTGFYSRSSVSREKQQGAKLIARARLSSKP